MNLLCLFSKNSKKHIIITANIEKAELFDRPPPLAGFWSALLCRGGSLIDQVGVLFDTKGGTDQSSVYRWYPRTLIKTLLLVSFSPVWRLILVSVKPLDEANQMI